VVRVYGRVTRARARGLAVAPCAIQPTAAGGWCYQTGLGDLFAAEVLAVDGGGFTFREMLIREPLSLLL
jgi:hypothetical protein